MIPLWPHQERAIALLDQAVSEGSRKPLLTLATGAGKTVIAAALMCRSAERGERALFLAPRRELVVQASRQLARVGLGHGVQLAGADAAAGLYASTMVASVDTLLARMVRSRRLTIADPHLVIVDEAHLSITDIRKGLLDLWPSALRVGMTATPCRKDGRALGLLYDKLVEPMSCADLVRAGRLVPARYFSLTEPDLSRVHTVAGEWHQGELSLAVNQPRLVGNVVTHWLKLAGGRRTVVFACSIAHSVALCEEFLHVGVAAEHVDADTPQELRDATFGRFRDGKTQVLCNCFLASYGFDLPELSAVVLARPTQSLMLYLQMCGRGLRAAPGKSDCLILDHSGSVHRHGFAHAERRWTLAGKFALESRDLSPREQHEAKALTCPDCRAVFSGARLCPECGYFFAPKGKEVRTLAGELVEIGEHLPRDEQDRYAFLAELMGYAAEKHYRSGWCAHKFKEKFGDWPPRSWASAIAAQPSIETRRWIKSRTIAWLKSRDVAHAEL